MMPIRPQCPSPPQTRAWARKPRSRHQEVWEGRLSPQHPPQLPSPPHPHRWAPSGPTTSCRTSHGGSGAPGGENARETPPTPSPQFLFDFSLSLFFSEVSSSWISGNACPPRLTQQVLAKTEVLLPIGCGGQSSGPEAWGAPPPSAIRDSAVGGRFQPGANSSFFSLTRRDLPSAWGHWVGLEMWLVLGPLQPSAFLSF